MTALKEFAATHPNTEVLVEDVTKPLAPMTVDIVFTAQNYHDFHNLPERRLQGDQQGGVSIR